MQKMLVWSQGLHWSSGEGNGKPLQYSCLRNPSDRGVWLVTVYGAAKSLTWLSNWVCTCTINSEVGREKKRDLGLLRLINYVRKKYIWEKLMLQTWPLCTSARLILDTEFGASLVFWLVKRLPAVWEIQVRSLGWEDPVTTLVFLPGESYGQRSLAEYGS